MCEGRTQCIPKPTPGNYSKYKNKEEYTNTIILNIKKDKRSTNKKKRERKNMKKNHINFPHPNKWSDSLASPMESPSVATKIATGRRTKKIKFVKTEFGVTIIVIIGNYGKP